MEGLIGLVHTLHQSLFNNMETCTKNRRAKPTGENACPLAQAKGDAGSSIQALVN
jgi:hypothetical protein